MTTTSTSSLFSKAPLEHETTAILRQNYRPLARLDEGGMGQVFAVQELTSGRVVALKTVRSDKKNDDQYVQQFMREAVITARLQHPHIIPVYEIGFLRPHKRLYYTMRLVEGNNLAAMQPKISLDAHLTVLLKVASAVHFAHTQGLWHRDLKPSNILLGFDGGVYVIDWGTVTVQNGARYELKLPEMIREHAEAMQLDEPMPDLLIKQTPDALSTNTGVLLGTTLSRVRNGQAEARQNPLVTSDS